MEALNNPVGLIIALIGAGGVGGLFREIVSVLTKFRSGISAKETNRKNDVISERDYEYDRAEAYRRNFQRIDEAYAELRIHAIDKGIPRDSFPERPRLEKIPDRTPDAPDLARE